MGRRMNCGERVTVMTDRQGNILAVAPASPDVSGDGGPVAVNLAAGDDQLVHELELSPNVAARSIADLHTFASVDPKTSRLVWHASDSDAAGD